MAATGSTVIPTLCQISSTDAKGTPMLPKVGLNHLMFQIFRDLGKP